MNKALYQYIVHNADKIAESSFRDCHAVGVDSLLLMPGLRIFHAHERHELENPTRGLIGAFAAINGRRFDFPVALHSHKTQLTISVLNGEVVNWIGTPTPGDNFLKFKHTSGITDVLRFERVGSSNLQIDGRLYKTGSTFSLNDQLHTITIDGGKSASWLVLEGSPIEYDGICYSQRDLDRMKFSLYKPMSRFDVLDLASRIFICN